jgi:hypothetical protein
MMPIASSCQRWRDRRASYRPAGELFDPSRAEVQAIDETTAKRFVVAHHYAAQLSRGAPARRPVRQAFGADRLAGVVVFLRARPGARSRPISRTSRRPPASSSAAWSCSTRSPRTPRAGSSLARSGSCAASCRRSPASSRIRIRSSARRPPASSSSPAMSAPSTRRRTPPIAAARAPRRCISRPTAASRAAEPLEDPQR